MAPRALHRAHPAWPSRHDIEAALDQAYGDLRGSVGKESMPEMAFRLATARLRERAAEDDGADRLYPPPTFW
jgi:hypothetical protein